MIHEDIILKSPQDTKNRIAANIKRNLARYPKVEFVCSGPLYTQLVDAGYIDAKDSPRRRQLEIILAIIQSA